MISVLACLPVRLKMRIMAAASSGAAGENWRLHMVNGLQLTIDDLAAVCLADDLISELQGGTSVSEDDVVIRIASVAELCVVCYCPMDSITNYLSTLRVCVSGITVTDIVLRAQCILYAQSTCGVFMVQTLKASFNIVTCVYVCVCVCVCVCVLQELPRMQEVLTVVCASPAEYANAKLAPLLFRTLAIVEEETKKMKTGYGVSQLLDASQRHAKNIKKRLKEAGVRLMSFSYEFE